MVGVWSRSVGFFEVFTFDLGFLCPGPFKFCPDRWDIRDCNLGADPTIPWEDFLKKIRRFYKNRGFGAPGPLQIDGELLLMVNGLNLVPIGSLGPYFGARDGLQGSDFDETLCTDRFDHEESEFPGPRPGKRDLRG